MNNLLIAYAIAYAMTYAKIFLIFNFLIEKIYLDALKYVNICE